MVGPRCSSAWIFILMNPCGAQRRPSPPARRASDGPPGGTPDLSSRPMAAPASESRPQPTGHTTGRTQRADAHPKRPIAPLPLLAATASGPDVEQRLHPWAHAPGAGSRAGVELRPAVGAAVEARSAAHGEARWMPKATFACAPTHSHTASSTSRCAPRPHSQCDAATGPQPSRCGAVEAVASSATRHGRAGSLPVGRERQPLRASRMLEPAHLH